jgi:hypothetical protein
MVFYLTTAHNNGASQPGTEAFEAMIQVIIPPSSWFVEVEKNANT